jgi:hypothetical protein
MRGDFASSLGLSDDEGGVKETNKLSFDDARSFEASSEERPDLEGDFGEGSSGIMHENCPCCFLVLGVGGAVLFDIGDAGRLSQGVALDGTDDDPDEDAAGIFPSPTLASHSVFVSSDLINAFLKSSNFETWHISFFT